MPDGRQGTATLAEADHEAVADRTDPGGRRGEVLSNKAHRAEKAMVDLRAAFRNQVFLVRPF